MAKRKSQDILGLGHTQGGTFSSQGLTAPSADIFGLGGNFEPAQQDNESNSAYGARIDRKKKLAAMAQNQRDFETKNPNNYYSGVPQSARDQNGLPKTGYYMADSLGRPIGQPMRRPFGAV